jgi:hypothetical protein
MLAREISPGSVVLADEDAVWREILWGESPTLPVVTKPPVVIGPGNAELCLVQDLSAAKEADPGTASIR